MYGSYSHFIPLVVSLIALYLAFSKNNNDSLRKRDLLPEMSQVSHKRWTVSRVEIKEECHNVNPYVIAPLDVSSLDAAKRDKIVEMIKHAWNGYRKYAWGSNQVRPVSKSADEQHAYFDGKAYGLTIIDSLDTLYLVGLEDEYKQAKSWVENEFQFDGPHRVSVFETNIRLVGGLLSAYTLTKAQVFLEKADEVARKLLPAFNTATGIPRALVNLETGSASSWGWVAKDCSILAEFGTLSLEFLYLSQLTGDDIFRNQISKVMTHLKNSITEDGIYLNYLDPSSGRWCSNSSSVGSHGDSFYEYLFKSWLMTTYRETEMKEAYDKSIDAIIRQFLYRSSKGNLYFAERQDGNLVHKMDHLACYMGSLFALSAKYSIDEKMYMEIADAIGETCRLSYGVSESGLGPDTFRFDSEHSEARALHSVEKHYLLRPEAIETYFYLWRLTHNQKWRQYGWEAVQAIEKHCRVDGGYSGVVDVYSLPVEHDDIQQSFFLAETLKYLYLLFSPDDLLPLDKFVFNTEAHPFLMFNKL